ncbi:prepilin-type cleavage/methylation domain-containing protein [Candidimonas nitroreducens]|uniref:Prepilin-type cleavage/methylation domain-containing protein n=2 Tax=Candidimonas nitroreducens TaxID=683354 RepID=A0A225MXD2_9BURK|nr:prepilin-type cleavage/methylation domain-containing protein [Candidimonas nitroreducens]
MRPQARGSAAGATDTGVARRRGCGHGRVARHGYRGQRGFSLVEVSIVTAIVLLLAIIGIPAIGSYVVENKVPRVGEELARFIAQARVNAAPGTALPYESIQTSNLASLLRDSGVLSISGADANVKVMHGLGSDGEVTVEPVEAGAAFSLTLTNVNHAACPGIASVMQRVSEDMSIAAGGQAAVTIKDDTVAYSAMAAQSHCAKGDVNTFVFVAG